MEKYDAIIVLDSPDAETDAQRMRTALNLYYTYKQFFPAFVLNGGRWHNDSSKIPYKEEVEKISHIKVYAENTEENALKTYELAKQNGWKKILVVSSRTHINDEFCGVENGGRVPWNFRKFFKFSQLDYALVEESSEHLRKRRAVCEKLYKFKNILENILNL
jgi:hypothetical protein